MNKYQIGDRITNDGKWFIDNICCMDGRCSYSIYGGSYQHFETTKELENWIAQYNTGYFDSPPDPSQQWNYDPSL